MTKYVAFLRGINVGGNNKVEMPKLKKAFESSGYKNVATYINTGNVIFESDKKNPGTLAQEIEKILKNLGFFQLTQIFLYPFSYLWYHESLYTFLKYLL